MLQQKLRTEEVGNMASKTSAIPEVRGKLLELQRTLAREKDVIMDGMTTFNYNKFKELVERKKRVMM